MSEKTHWKKIVSDPNFVGEGDFEPNEEKIVTIKSVNQSETVTTAEGKSQKAVVHFAETGIKPMILNVARSKSIEKVSGSGYFEDWPGVKITLYIEHGIKAFGEVVSAVRVRKIKPKVTVQAPPVPPCFDCKNQILAANGKPPAFIAQYTLKRYGVPLCAVCTKKRDAAEQEAKKTAQEQTDTATADTAQETTKPTAETEGTSNGNSGSDGENA